MDNCFLFLRKGKGGNTREREKLCLQRDLNSLEQWIWWRSCIETKGKFFLFWESIISSAKAIFSLPKCSSNLSLIPFIQLRLKRLQFLKWMKLLENTTSSGYFAPAQHKIQLINYRWRWKFAPFAPCFCSWMFLTYKTQCSTKTLMLSLACISRMYLIQIYKPIILNWKLSKLSRLSPCKTR